MRRILVLRGGALGDFLVTLPLLARTRAAFPGARVELVGNREAAAIGVDAGLLDAVHSQHDARWLALGLDAPLPAALREWLGAFDLVVNFWPDPDGTLARRFPVGPHQVFLARGALPASAPAAAHYAGILDALGAPPVPPYYALAETDPGARTIVLHPGSGSPRKNWPLDRWRPLAAWLRATHSNPVLALAGPAEPPAAADLGVSVLAGALPEVIAALRGAVLFLGHDSGISHLAAACGVPSILLFGPTDPARWAPPAPHVRVLQRGTALAEISLAEVQAAVGRALAG